MAADIAAHPPITLCMINRNGAEHLPRTLAAIDGQDWPFAEIVIVDDGSTDASLAIIQRDCPRARIVAHNESRGPAAARNAAFEAAFHHLILSIDNDVRLQPDTVEHLLAVLIEQPSALLAAPRTLYEAKPDTIQYESADCHFLGLMAPRNADRSAAATPRERARTSSVVTGCFLLHRGRWSGGAVFDEDFGFNLEDHDFGVRAGLLGHELWSEPRAEVLHGEGSAGLSYRPGVAASGERLFYLTRNRWVILGKSFSRRTLLLLTPPLALFELAQLVLLLGRGRGAVWWQALRSLMRTWPELRAERRAIQASRQIGDREILRDGPLPLTGWVRSGRLATIGVDTLQTTFRLYWRLVERFI